MRAGSPLVHQRTIADHRSGLRAALRQNRHPLILTIVTSLLCIAYVLLNRYFSKQEFEARTFAFLILLALACTVSCEIFSREGKAILNAVEPLHFYSVFFAAFYVLPFTLIVLDPRIDGVLYVRVGMAILVGFLAFKCGCRSIKRAGAPSVELDGASSWALLISSWIAMALVGYLYYWRLRNGNFYTHANSYTVGTDTTSSLLESFVNHLTLPTFFLCGLVASSSTTAARPAKLTIKLYLLSTFLIFLAASQLRFTVTVLILGWVALHLFERSQIEWKLVLHLATVCVVAAALIFTIRASGAGTGLSDSDNQLRDLWRGVTSGELLDTSQLSSATTSTEGTSTVGRAVTPLIFFSDVMQTLDTPSASFGLGDSFLYELQEIIPRLLWKDKPEFLSTQIFIRGNLGMREVDSSPHPLLQFYYEFGWPGIAAGFFS